MELVRLLSFETFCWNFFIINNNKFRGWLCTRCNTGIGLFDDDTKLLQEAINYIKNSETECI